MTERLFIVDSDNTWVSPVEERVNRLWDILTANPDGVDVYYLIEHLECSRPLVNQAVRKLRDLLGTDEDINVIAEPQGMYEPYLYRLVGNYEDMKPWAGSRLSDLIRRIQTIENVASSIARHETDDRQARKRARVINTSMKQCLENLELLEDLST